MERAAFPPGLRLPAALQTAWLAYRPYRFFEHCRARHGEAFTVATLLGRVPVFARPDYVEEIFARDGETLLGGSAQTPVVVFAGEQSLMRLDGPEHRAHREILASAFRVADLPQGGAEVLERIRKTVAGWPSGRRFDLGAAIERLALDLVANLVLGLDGPPAELAAPVWDSWRLLRRKSTPLGLIREGLARPGRSGCPFAFVRKCVEDYLDTMIARAEPAAAGASCVFERVANGCSSRGVRLDPRAIRDEVMMLLVAMLGALSCSIKHSFAWTLRTPGVAARVRSATAPVVARGDVRAIMGETYLEAVCKEILRLSPDIPFAVRRAAVDVTIGGWRLPAGTTLGIGIYLLHRREAAFPEPSRFLPERFLTGARPSRFEYMPFGGGRRGCVAGVFFTLVQKLILAAAFERHDLRLCQEGENPVTSLAFISTPARPLWTIARPLPGPRPRPRPGIIVHPAEPVPARGRGAPHIQRVVQREQEPHSS